MTTFDLILAYPLTALVVFLAAVAVLWLCLAVGICAAWVAGVVRLVERGRPAAAGAALVADF